MQKFDLTIFRLTRIYIGIVLLPVGILGSIFLGRELGGFLFGIILITLFLFLLGYFIIGYMTISIDNDKLLFQWKRKYFFNYKDITPVKLSDIKTIILDNGQFLRKIETDDRVIHINNSKIKSKDASNFIYQLSIVIKKYNIRKIDSWDVWIERGYLKIAYWINAVTVAFVSLILIIAIAKGIFTRNFFCAFLLLPQQVLFGLQMRCKLGKKQTNL